jgi:hypothetical protein
MEVLSMDYAPSVHDNVVNGSGLGMSGMGGWGIVIFLFLLFAIFSGGMFGRRDDHHENNHSCGPKPWMIDRDILDQGCKDRDATNKAAEKTNALIVHEAERNEDRYIRGLETKNATLENEKYTTGLVAGLAEKGNNQFYTLINMLKDGFCRTDAEIATLSCELPKRPNVYARCDTDCLQQIPDHKTGYQGNCYN